MVMTSLQSLQQQVASSIPATLEGLPSVRDRLNLVIEEAGAGGKQLELEQNIAVDCIDSFFDAVHCPSHYKPESVCLPSSEPWLDWSGRAIETPVRFGLFVPVEKRPSR